LLATGKLAAEQRLALLQPGKQSEHRWQVPWAGADFGDLEVLGHRETAKDLAPLRDIADAEPGDPMCRPTRRIAAENLDRAAPGWGETNQTAHSRGFAGAIATEHGDDFTFPHLE